MKKQITKYIGLPLLAFFAINCAVITVNVYFPTEAVEEAAERIIDEIEGEEDANAELDNSEQHSFFHTNVPFIVFGVSTVYADEIDMNLTSPAIRKLIDSMKARNSEIMHFKDKGVFGETNDGMLANKEMSGLDGNEIRTVNRLRRAENTDREALYKELAIANKIELSEINRIKAAFAKARRSKAKPNHWYQDEEGKWLQK
jgi:uncharacterized protein YdbL (DUF1318 family)